MPSGNGQTGRDILLRLIVDVEDLKTSFKSMQGQVGAMHGEMQSMQKQMQSMQKQMHSMQKQAAAMGKTLTHATGTLDKMRYAFEQLVESLGESQARLDRLEAEEARDRARLDALEARVSKLEGK